LTVSCGIGGASYAVAVAEIRPFEHEDLPAIAKLLGDHLDGWDGDTGLIQAAFLDHPWADPETPSLVIADDDGVAVGFIGVHPRRLDFGADPVKGVCCTHLVVHPDGRAAGGGAQLVRQVMAGPQELTWSDTTVPVVARMWAVFGGRTDYARAADWLIVLRPMRWTGQAITGRVRGRARTDEVPVPGFPAHASRRLTPQAHQPTPPEVSGADATVTELVAAQPEVTRRHALFVAYDEAALAFTLEKLEGMGKRIVRRLVRRGDRTIGWYAYIERPGGVSRVIHLAAAARDADHVLGELLDHARESGSSAMWGRYEPHLDAALRSRLAVLGLNTRPAMRTRNEKVGTALAGDGSLLTRLDGEWNLL
jgi:GNAT superfamily N-acetyltransferase